MRGNFSYSYNNAVRTRLKFRTNIKVKFKATDMSRDADGESKV